MTSRSGDSVEKLDSLVDSVLKLEVVYEDELVTGRRLLLVELVHQEPVIRLPKGLIQDLFLAVFANGVSTGVNHGVVLQEFREPKVSGLDSNESRLEMRSESPSVLL